MKIKIYTAPTEIEASIIKGVFDSVDIPASIFPAKENMTTVQLITGPNAPHDVFVEEDKIKEATSILKEKVHSTLKCNTRIKYF
jgi:hypothetical protein